MSNAYDKAYELAKAIKNSDEVKAFAALHQKIAGNAEAQSLLGQWRGKQMELQMKQMQGQSITPEETEAFNALLGRIRQNADLAKWLEAEQRLNVLMNDVNRIVLEPLKEWLQPPGGGEK